MSRLQGEHERSQSRLFELESSREERMAASQRDVELDEEEAQRTQRLLACDPDASDAAMGSARI